MTTVLNKRLFYSQDVRDRFPSIPAEVGKLNLANNVILYSIHCLLAECQIEDIVAKLQHEISSLKASLLERPEFDVTVLVGNDKLCRYFTGIPTCSCYTVLANYLDPEVKAMRAWKGSSTSSAEKQFGSQCFSSLSIANPMFAVLIRLRLALPLTDVSRQFKLPEATYCCMFTTWLSKELHQMFPFPSHEKMSKWMPRRFKKHFQIQESLLTVMKLNVSGHLDSSIHL